MSALLPLQTALPSWLEVGASPLEFETAIAQLEQGLEGLVVLDVATPEASIAAQLRDIFAPGQTPRPLKNLRQLLLGVMRRPEAARVFAEAMARARAQTQTGWVSQARRRFAEDPTACLKQAEQTERVVVTRLLKDGHLHIAGKKNSVPVFTNIPMKQLP